MGQRHCDAHWRAQSDRADPGWKIQQVDRGLALPQNLREADDMTSLYYIYELGVLHKLEERCKLDGDVGHREG